MLGTTHTAVIMYLTKLQVDMFLLTLGFLLTYKVYPKFRLPCQMGKKINWRLGKTSQPSS